MTRAAKFLESLDLGELPKAPGTVSIPSGYVRLYHQTSLQNVASIARTGIKLDYAKGYEGPAAIYADEQGFYGKPGDVPTVEFAIPKSRWSRPFVHGDIDPKDIIAIHLPWHDHARYAEKNPAIIKQILAGEFDDMLSARDPEWAPALAYIKRKHSGKFESRSVLYHTTSPSIGAEIMRTGVFRAGRGGFVSFSDLPGTVYDISNRGCTLAIDLSALQSQVVKVEYTRTWARQYPEQVTYIAGEGWVEQYDNSHLWDDAPEDDDLWEPDQEDIDQDYADAEFEAFRDKSNEREWVSLHQGQDIRVSTTAIKEVG